MSAPLGPFEFVVGSDRVDFYLTFKDENDQPINITGATELKVQGKSEGLPSVNLDVSGTIYDGPNGIAKFTAFGNAITVSNLGSLTSAGYLLRGKFKDAANKTTFTREFIVTWFHQPL